MAYVTVEVAVEWEPDEHGTIPSRSRVDVPAFVVAKGTEAITEWLSDQSGYLVKSIAVGVGPVPERNHSIEDCWLAVMDRIKSEETQAALNAQRPEGTPFTEKWLTEEGFTSIVNDLYDFHRAMRDHGSPKTDWFVTLKNSKDATEPRPTMRVKLDVYNTLKGR